MERSIYNHLLLWKKNENRQVLLLRGARQVGKTHSIRTLGGTFEHFLEVNFEEKPFVHSFFESSLTPSSINEKLSAYYDIPITPGKTLLFFDEIQACPNAIRSLRFYQEQMPHLHVIAAGSLLEFALSEIPSFGVGRISSLFMYPLSFGEFLKALGKEQLTHFIDKSSEINPLDKGLHHLLLEKLQIYQIIGGMPAVVNAYTSGTDLRTCQSLLDNLILTFEDDFAKYKKRSPVTKLSETFRSISKQAGSKFKYSNIIETGPIYGYKEALDLLIMAGLAYKVEHTKASGIPLGAQTDPKKFKILPFDLGIHQRILGLDLAELISLKYSEFIHKGSLAEVFVGNELISNDSLEKRPQLYYWHREIPNSNAEIDYVIQRGEKIIPMEVKSGTRGQMQSLHLFLKEKNLPYGIRLSHENFGKADKVKIFPLYAVKNLF